MRTPYEVSVVADNEEIEKNKNNSAIPYHARENSLPFSYGQIKHSSTPLRSAGGGGGGGYSFGNSNGMAGEYGGYGGSRLNGSSRSGLDVNFNLNGDQGYDSHLNRSSFKTTTTTVCSETDANMIKSQPRLTSPLLVRKTLNTNNNNGSSSRSGTTNTISNTYPYQYGNEINGKTNNSNNHNYGSSSVRLNENGNINNYGSGGYNHTGGNDGDNWKVRKTPTRNEFEELLRERREKVYNEYRTTTRDVPDAAIASVSPSWQQAPKPPQRASRPLHSGGQSKYHYDFEFNLNLLDDDVPLPPRRAHTIDRSTYQYQTRDIPVAREAVYVERNYHTISSSSSTNATVNAIRGETTTTYPNQERPPLEVTYNRRYGNGNAAGYGYSNTLDRVETSEQQTDMSPIYATATKKQVTTTNASARGTTEPDFANYAAKVSPTTPSLASRPETPAFPVTPRTPFGTTSSSYTSNTIYTQGNAPQRLDFRPSNGQSPEQQNYNVETIYQTINRPRFNSSLSLANSEPQEVAAHLVKFAKDSSKFWYKPNLSRDEAISLLLNAEPGTFIVRDSTTYKNAYGLVLRVAQPPPTSAGTGKLDELVRHFLIEPTTRGVRLKGSANEPVFTSLSAFVYEHSVNQLALPCLLRIPEQDLLPPLLEPTPAQKQLLTQGAATNVLWLYSCETESLTGEEAIRKAIRQLYAQKPLPTPTEVHFKVSQHGITLTDNTRKKFFRKHYTADIISYCAIDPDHRVWTMGEDGSVAPENAANNKSAVNAVGLVKKTIFAFVARRSASSKDNQCHVFCDLAVSQPASAIVTFLNKTLPTEKQRNYVL